MMAKPWVGEYRFLKWSKLCHVTSTRRRHSLSLRIRRLRHTVPVPFRFMHIVPNTANPRIQPQFAPLSGLVLHLRVGGHRNCRRRNGDGFHNLFLLFLPFFSDLCCGRGRQWGGFPFWRQFKAVREQDWVGNKRGRIDHRCRHVMRPPWPRWDGGSGVRCAKLLHGGVKEGKQINSAKPSTLWGTGKRSWRRGVKDSAPQGSMPRPSACWLLALVPCMHMHGPEPLLRWASGRNSLLGFPAWFCHAELSTRTITEEHKFPGRACISEPCSGGHISCNSHDWLRSLLRIVSWTFTRALLLLFNLSSFLWVALQLNPAPSQAALQRPKLKAALPCPARPSRSPR